MSIIDTSLVRITYTVQTVSAYPIRYIVCTAPRQNFPAASKTYGARHGNIERVYQHGRSPFDSRICDGKSVTHNDAPLPLRVQVRTLDDDSETNLDLQRGSRDGPLTD